MVDESKAGIRYVDLHMGSSESIVTGMLPENILEPLEPLMLLPEVRDPKHGGAGTSGSITPKSSFTERLLIRPRISGSTRS